jgi:hypothetical protein
MTRTPNWIFTLTRTSTSTVTQTRTFTPIYTRTNTSVPTRTRTPAPPTATVNSTLVVPTGPVTPMQLINAVNLLRTANGFPALVVNSTLMGTAQWTAETMAVNHYMNHLVWAMPVCGIGSRRQGMVRAPRSGQQKIGQWVSRPWHPSWWPGLMMRTCCR